MAWNVKGTYIETCSCDFFCPCNASLANGADYDYCRVTLVFNITEGNVEGTDVGGLKVAAIADTPKVMTEGNWRLGMFIDDKASEEQAEKLMGVFSGQLGGPMEALGPLVGGGQAECRPDEPDARTGGAQVDEAMRRRFDHVDRPVSGNVHPVRRADPCERRNDCRRRVDPPDPVVARVGDEKGAVGGDRE